MKYCVVSIAYGYVWNGFLYRLVMLEVSGLLKSCFISHSKVKDVCGARRDKKVYTKS